MPLTTAEIRRLLRFAERTAKGAGRILTQGFKRQLKVDYKGRINPVTDYDLKSERYIVSRIRRRYPGHTILAEEGSSAAQQSPFRWVIDPLDGTVNYAHGFPVYCVSIALEYEGTTVAGVVYDPERDELFRAGARLGAFLNGRRIRVSNERKLERALLATGFAYNIGSARRNNLGYFARMAKKAQAIRRVGSAAIDLCWLACGRMDGFWEIYLHPWDTAAAKLIVEQVGGRVSRISGREFSIFAVDILASNGYLHKALMAALTGKRR